MAVFDYKALSSSGSVESGSLKASERSEALAQLQKKGLRPIKVVKQEESPSSSEKKQETKRSSQASGGLEVGRESAEGMIKLSKNELVLFTEELSDMLASGLQLEPALGVLEKRADKGNIRLVAQRLRSQVRDGISFSLALKRTSPAFGNLYCSLAAAGEASGSLDKILKRQGEHMEAIQEIQSQVKGALIYPAFILAVVFFVCLFVLFYLLPQLMGLMKNMAGTKVPFLATFLMGLTTFLKAYWLYLLAGSAFVGFLFKWWKDTPENRPVWDEMKLKIPLVGGILSARFYVLFMETLANLISNGLPLVRCLELARDATDNLFARQKIEKVIDQVGDGRALSQSLLKTELFPPVIVDMVVVGEQTGKLDVALSNAAKRSDKQLKETISRLMALMMPVILVILALVIGSVLFLIFSLIGETINNIKR